jgi:hypothetical protein
MAFPKFDEDRSMLAGEQLPITAAKHNSFRNVLNLVMNINDRLTFLKELRLAASRYLQCCDDTLHLHRQYKEAKTGMLKTGIE